MEPLFEAKVTVEGQYALYNVYRLEPETYKALLIKNDDDNQTNAPTELVVTKRERKWYTEGDNYSDIGSTIGIEIDVFNTGYGALLGRIGVDI